MKRILCGLLLALAGQVQAMDWRDSPAVAEAFARAGVTGTFVLHEVGSERWRGHNRQRALTRYSPASTFKIAHTLIGLDTGVVSGLEEVFPFDGKPKFLKSWEKDMGLREALKVSNVSVYQALARRIGLARMRSRVAALDYGNGEIGNQVDQFWLRGPLAISAVEQARFLARLVQDQLPVTPAIQAQVRDISLLEQGPDWRLYGKTGWATSGDPDIGWWVGWVEQQGRRYSFALNIDTHCDADLPTRIELGKASLRLFKLL
ncbi:class D beta-lactamase [Pseudomonas sp. MBLB4136]|uniref:class D beta-lactamase n=1 Tax=Pseudomonas sp. MBLB4136 TaxID=3451558 RepID=UPI003F7550AC